MKTQSFACCDFVFPSLGLGFLLSAEGIFKSTSGKSSKLDVSSMDFTCTGMAAGLSRICSQSTGALKNNHYFHENPD